MFFIKFVLDEKQNGSHREDVEKLGSKDKNYSDMTAGEDPSVSVRDKTQDKSEP